MKSIVTIICVTIALLLPEVVSAHAAPIEYAPASSAQLSEAPQEIRIRFSERVEPGASRIVVQDDTGRKVHTGNAVVDSADAHFLSVPLEAVEKGTFLVTWSVVSSDDGHFTKGGYAYFVGTTATSTVASTPQIEIVQLSALPEATAMFIELLGNSFLWGALILFALVLRSLMPRVTIEQGRILSIAYQCVIYTGALCVLGGGIAHTILKTTELAALHAISLKEALPLYLATVSGSATVIRSAAITVFGLVFLARRKAILGSMRFTWSEAVLLALLSVFAFYRAKVSHATANLFFPEVSVAINFAHLIGKGLWEGLLGGLSLIYLSRTLRPLLPQILTKTFALLSLSFGIVGASAAYIVWLHLKDFQNITSTLWGQRFLPLAAVAILAFLMLAYHVIANRRHGDFVNKFMPYTLPAEFAVGILIVFFSSLMIITSPPIEKSHSKVFETESNGLTITIEKAPYEDGMVLLSVGGNESTQDPIVIIGGEGGLIVDLQRRFAGGYVFPSTILSTTEAKPLHISVSQEGGYDAQANFLIERDDVDPAPVKGHGRTLDLFTTVMILIGLSSVVASIILYRLSHSEYSEPNRKNSITRFVVGFLLGLVIASQLIGLLLFLFGNDYKKECAADGNGWHIMLPTKNGIPVSSTPREGCMALNGSYHLPDAREYRFFKNPGETAVIYSTDLSNLRAGVPVNLQFSIKDQDGYPAALSIQHERLIHFIAISADMRDFKHIHPDDSGPLTDEAVRNSTFSIPINFPRAGEYILALDYAHGLTPTSKFVKVTVSDGPSQDTSPLVFPETATFEGYDVSLDYSLPVAGEPATLIYTIKRDGKSITNLTPYLAAAMHVAVVKNDLSEFLHTHGEVHIPGAPVKPLSKANIHQHAPPPPQFGPMIESHPIFPTAGLYTVFGQFKHEGKVVVTSFTVRVEE